MAGARLVVWIGAVGVDADDRVRLGPQAGDLEGVHDEALDGVLVDLVAAPEKVGHAVERLEDDPVQVDVGAAVTGELLRSPGGDELLRQVGGGDHLDAGRAQQLEGAGVQARDGGQLVVRAVLGGEPGESGDQLRHPLAVPLPGVVDGLLAGQMVQHARLDGVDELPGLPFPGHQVVAAAADQLALAREAQEGHPERIVLLEAGEEPAVEAGLGQRGLDFRNLLSQHRTSLFEGLGSYHPLREGFLLRPVRGSGTALA